MSVQPIRTCPAKTWRGDAEVHCGGEMEPEWTPGIWTVWKCKTCGLTEAEQTRPLPSLARPMEVPDAPPPVRGLPRPKPRRDTA